MSTMEHICDAGFSLPAFVLFALFVVVAARTKKTWKPCFQTGNAIHRASRQEEVDGEKSERSMGRIQSLLFWSLWIFLSLLWCIGFVYTGTMQDARRVSSPTALIQGNGLMDVFQVYRPPPPPYPAPDSPASCDVLLMDHVFAFSYGKPFVGSYTPPTCPFNSVTMTLTVTSRGRQFDRLGLMFLGDVEVFRTSTAEPTAGGIIWTYKKDMTAYIALWRQPQKLIFDLGNLIDDKYTGTFNATLTASFFNSPSPPVTADLVLPISTRRSAFNASSEFGVPGDNATVSQLLPSNVLRAVVSVSACGQATEEFWYSNVLSQDTDAFVNTTGPLYGFSPFREIQLLIDGHLAGVVWPFPVIFTGGIAPGFWRPIVGIDAFDLREPEIDITPWVPWLTDEQEHQFQIRVIGLDGDGSNLSLSNSVGDYWVVTGKILLFLGDGQGPARNLLKQSLPSIFAPEPSVSAQSRIGQSENGTNVTLSYSVRVSRSIVITSGAGSWVQTMEYANGNILTSEGLSQFTTQSTTGNLALINLGDPRLSHSTSFSYPLSVNTTIGNFEDRLGISIDASLSRGLLIDSTGTAAVSLFTLAAGETSLNTSQSGTAHYSSEPNKTFSFGDTTQDFVEDSAHRIYLVHVRAVNGSIAMLSGDGHQAVGESDAGNEAAYSKYADFPNHSLRSMVGRGPGRPTRSPPKDAVSPAEVPEERTVYCLRLHASSRRPGSHFLDCLCGPFNNESPLKLMDPLL